jgi:protein TonB
VISAIQSSTRERAIAAVGKVVLEVLLGLVLVFGLSVDLPKRVSEGLKVFNVARPKPPPVIKQPVQPPAKSHKHSGAAAPPNIKSKATPIVAPPPVVPYRPPPVIAAPKPFMQDDASTGATQRVGPGTGAGGRGTGTGSGGEGYGEGAGETPPVQIRGRIKDSDYPRDARDGGFGGTVSVIYTVETDGHVTGCRVTRSSGHASLDYTTCRLIEERFRYRPSRDNEGRPVQSRVGEDHTWVYEGDPDPPEHATR